MTKFTEEQYGAISEHLQAMHPDAGCELEYQTPFQLLIAVILSAQCTDKRVNLATRKLFPVYGEARQFAELTPEDLKPYIFSCGFYNNKAKNIIATAKALTERFHGEVPRSLDELTALGGVGRKTASVVLSVAFGIPAMPVDTHVFRVSRRIGLSEGTTVERVESDLRAAYPPELWNTLHHTLIFHGRYICHARKPDCESCTLKNLCKAYITQQF